MSFGKMNRMAEIVEKRRIKDSEGFTSDQEVLDVVEKAILFFRDEGISGERFADTIDRLGFDYVEDKLLHNSIDRDAILKKTVKGGATC